MLGSDHQRREFLFGIVHILFTIGSDMPAVRSMYFPWFGHVCTWVADTSRVHTKSPSRYPLGCVEGA